ncbi:signal transduction histidine kinase [Anaerosolibacter carboniphilus]|uniref:histidine kinase n=1 Tax=Anaerosolibacter carboniphilus TaxID=1417629 RepID=A0A841KTM0_9FIRM|nr:HAMP domain-containing sensor histidine kinase [Anaerosolibacter carboniphilus]MBB6214272.1 signal transduction histidine kinase [Anaerosolibacter carboniphilus]
MKISIKIKFSAFLVLLLLSTVSILSIFVLQGIRNNQKSQYENYLIQQGEIASNYIKQTYLMESIKDSGSFLDERSQELVKRFEMMSGMHVVLYNMSGKEIANSRPAARTTDVSKLLEYALQDKITYLEEGNNIIFLSPLHHTSKQIGVIAFSYPTEREKIFYTRIKYLFLYVGILVFAICFICGYLYVHPLAQGILKLKNTARRIEEGNYADIVQLNRNDELGELSKAIYFMGFEIKRNVDAMKKEENKLKLAVEKLEFLGKQQKQFIGNVTHEFKTPLTVIKAYADLIAMYPDDSKLMREAKENIDKEVQRLSDMVEKVLALSALEKYDFELRKEEIDIYEVLNDICERMKGKIQKYGLCLHTNLKHHRIMADKESLMQIFINLIDNAIKYNRPNGEIWIDCSEKEDSLCIYVRNTGIGIPIDARDKIFEPFYTVNKDRSRQSGSTGLGLALVNNLVQRQGGTIMLLDIEEEGAAFEIKFPI